LQKIQSHSRGNFKIENLFRGTGNSYYQGARFERELTNTILSIMELVAQDSKQISTQDIYLGTQTGKTISNELDNIGQDIVNNLGEQMQKELEKEKGKFLHHQKSVQGKIDVRGYTIDVRADVDPQLLRIYDLLKTATFSAKSYASMT
jgi:hypothetical protein